MHGASHMVRMDQEELREYYSEGWCHAFACAAVDLYGGRVVVIENHDEEPNLSEAGEEIPHVHHVYSVHEGPDGDIAFDVFGSSPYDEDLDLLNDAWERWGYRGFEVVGPMSVADFRKRYESTDLSTKALNQVTTADLTEAKRWVAEVWNEENRPEKAASLKL